MDVLLVAQSVAYERPRRQGDRTPPRLGAAGSKGTESRASEPEETLKVPQ